MSNKNRPEPGPLELLFMLVDCVMPRLSPNAWKVVCYVAVQHIRVHPELLEQIREPALYALRRDLEHFGRFDAPGEMEERPYRSSPSGPSLPGAGTRRLAIVSLEHLCLGVRTKRGWRDYGTGLSKSSVAAGIQEALQSGILFQKREKSSTGRDLPSLYAIDWDRVREDERHRRHRATHVSKQRTPDLGQKKAE